MFIINHRKIFFLISIIAVALSIFSIGYFGLNLGIDFTGGSILEVSYADGRPETTSLRQALDQGGYPESSIQPAGTNSVIFRLRPINELEKSSLLKVVSLENKIAIEQRFSSIGPTVSSELAQKGIIALAIVSVLIVLFIALTFNGVSKPVSSWVYGLIAVLALLHDIIIPTGVFAVLGHLYGVEIDALFLTAVLTILGLSVNDTIVVFDRIRENLKNKISNDFATTVGISLEQTFVRSLNTSLTVLIVLVALYIFGGTTTKDFSLVLIIGTAVGAYSSLFIASPLLVTWQKMRESRLK